MCCFKFFFLLIRSGDSIRLSERARPLPWRSNGALVENPRLAFRSAKEDEAPALRALYEDAWGGGITIGEGQLIQQMRNFPEGQIVGCDGGAPVAMINIMLTDFDASSGFVAGYERVSGGRTFSTHVPFSELLGREDLESHLPVALCMSIAVRKSHAKNGYAIETLNHAIAFAEENGIFAVPYSAPRGFAQARARNPELDLETYLHMTIPGPGYDEHCARVGRLNRMPRITRAFRNGSGERLLLAEESAYLDHQGMGPDGLFGGTGSLAFSRFRSAEGSRFMRAYGRFPEIEDFCLLTGRKLLDPVMRMHVENGARFIRDREGRIAAAFRDSRPEDLAAAGYNVLLTYAYHPLLGQPYADFQRT